MNRVTTNWGPEWQNVPIAAFLLIRAFVRADKSLADACEEQALLLATAAAERGQRLRIRTFNMMARWALSVAAVVLLTAGGCACGPCGGACAGGACGPILPQPIRYPGSQDCEGCNSTFAWCRPPGGRAVAGGACGSCATTGSPCGGCGILNFLRCRMTACKGCGEVYYGEWVSDPPDCCDPCDRCFGQYTGHGNCCPPGFLARLAAGIRGTRCGVGPCGCGQSGCSSCGSAHWSHEAAYGDSFEQAGPQSILEEDWDLPPGPKPVPGKPIHKAQTPTQQRAMMMQPGMMRR
jgi:hypothetical protein